MSSYIELRKEAFGERIKEQAKQGISAAYAGVRRPLRGIEIKEDTYALLKVIKSDGTEVQLIDSSGNPRFQAGSSTISSRPYSNFIISQLSEARAEKAQIVETFGDSFIFFFGEKPRSISFQGLLLNTADFNWKAEWWENYEKYMRGTRLVEMDARLYLFYDDVLLEGYLMNAQTSDVPSSRNHVVFNATLVLTDYVRISPVGTGKYPIQYKESIFDDEPEDNRVQSPFDDDDKVTSAGKLVSTGNSKTIQTSSGTRSVSSRSFLSDNRDEYIGGSDYWTDTFDYEGVFDDDEADVEISNKLTAMGHDPEKVGKVLRAGPGITKVSEDSSFPFND